MSDKDSKEEKEEILVINNRTNDNNINLDTTIDWDSFTKEFDQLNIDKQDDDSLTYNSSDPNLMIDDEPTKN